MKTGKAAWPLRSIQFLSRRDPPPIKTHLAVPTQEMEEFCKELLRHGADHHLNFTGKRSRLAQDHILNITVFQKSSVSGVASARNPVAERDHSLFQAVYHGQIRLPVPKL